MSPAAGIRVQKFGGAALADGPSVARACELVRTRGGRAPVVVVSAVEGVTEELVRLARERGGAATVRVRHRSLLRQLDLDGELLDRLLGELEHVLAALGRRGAEVAAPSDHLLSFGERMSARVVAAALRARGVPALPVDAWDLGLVVEVRAGAPPRPVDGSAAAVARALSELPGVPVVTGFLAADRRGNLTTLGRNGSDLTALFLGAAVGAEEIQLWKAVPGIHTADPRLVPGARPLPRVGLAEALELSLAGARVLHPEAARLARRRGLRVRLLDTRAPEAPGTLLVADGPNGPTALVHRAGLLHARGPERALAAARRALRTLGEAAGARRAAGGMLSPDRPATRELLARAGASIETGLAEVSVVGSDAGRDAALLARAAAALAREGVELRAAELGARRRSFRLCLRERDLARALALLHAELFESLAPAPRVPSTVSLRTA